MDAKLEQAAGAASVPAPALNGTRPSAGALAVLAALEGAGLEAWIVGGWVRDALLGAPSHDVDICCAGSWQENEAALEAAGIRVVESGVRFGGIAAIAGGERIEVTSYRLDGFYTDGRHPESVQRARTVEEDLARRDFTVNAMAWHPERGLLDCFDGAGDLARRQIRAVGEPRRRFEEDALRMLRAVRFACRLDFSMDPATAEALAACAPLLDAVARERVGWELDGILATGRGGDALLHYPELMCAAIPELAACRGFDQHSRYHAFDVYEHTARVLTVAGELSLSRVDGAGPDTAPSPSLMWAALLHDVEKPACFTLDERGNGHFYGHPERSAEAARAIMGRLACPGALVRDACLLIRYHDRPLEAERTDLLRMMGRLSGSGLDTVRLMNELLDLKRADTLGKAPSCFYYVEDIERMREMVRELVANREPYSTSTLDLSGRDLIEAGVKPGRQVGALLSRALDAAIDGVVPNARAELLAYLGL
ncbi:CCA tRNA nucleotidyltransferase [[Collinsella] massiliensis]|uniref:Polynucleotide adenylyltransferase n=1 Tax=[Collinsella] massiliensis TaxID=1232426 RepID=A0A1Y3XU78_9ACTN|nr:CCA tRNA nucleotidyltransferase [[Collinsella] massiliensis]OUN89055.1 polynucleotide adenylyltransferase [[Collinsella] massiliensis]